MTDPWGALRRVSVVLFDGFELLDVFGPVELFSMVPAVAVEFVGPRAEPVASSQGARVVADRAYPDLRDPDIILVPGGAGTRQLAHDKEFLAWLGEAGRRAALVASVCTGSALVAASGLLEGRRATSNKAAFTWVTGFGTTVEWQPHARWVEDGDRWSSSGVAAGMDMTVALIARLFGAEVAETAARRAEYEPQRDSTRDAFAEVFGLG